MIYACFKVVDALSAQSIKIVNTFGGDETLQVVLIYSHLKIRKMKMVTTKMSLEIKLEEATDFR